MAKDKEQAWCLQAFILCSWPLFISCAKKNACHQVASLSQVNCFQELNYYTHSREQLLALHILLLELLFWLPKPRGQYILMLLYLCCYNSMSYCLNFISHSWVSHYCAWTRVMLSYLWHWNSTMWLTSSIQLIFLLQCLSGMN